MHSAGQEYKWGRRFVIGKGHQAMLSWRRDSDKTPVAYPLSFHVTPALFPFLSSPPHVLSLILHPSRFYLNVPEDSHACGTDPVGNGDVFPLLLRHLCGGVQTLPVWDRLLRIPGEFPQLFRKSIRSIRVPNRSGVTQLPLRFVTVWGPHMQSRDWTHGPISHLLKFSLVFLAHNHKQVAKRLLWEQNRMQ